MGMYCHFIHFVFNAFIIGIKNSVIFGISKTLFLLFLSSMSRQTDDIGKTNSTTFVEEYIWTYFLYVCNIFFIRDA